MTTTNFQAVLFDLDGTLLNTSKDLSTAIDAALEKYNITKKKSIDHELARFNSSKQLFFGAAGITDEHPELNAMVDTFHDEYEKKIAKHTQFYPGISDTLQTLQNHHIPWGIITNKPSHLTKALLPHFPILSSANIILGGDALPEHKPSAMPLRHACKQLNIKPISCVYVGDTKTDFLAANRAGLTSITMLYGFRDTKDNPNTWGETTCLTTGNDLHQWVQQQNTHK